MTSLQFSTNAAGRRERTSDHPLTHHEIMTLVGPFRERGWHVDLPASDRPRRQLCFRPVAVAAQPGRHPALESVLRLELPERRPARLTRTLTDARGLAATASAEGAEPAALLDQIEQVAAARQMRLVGDTLLALSYRVSSGGGASLFGADGARPEACRPRLVRAEARFGPVTFKASEGASQSPWDVALTGAEGRRLNIPEDLLAVVGWAWRPLRLGADGTWRGTVKPPKREPARTQVLEKLLVDAAAHLSATFAAPPAAFHERHERARWRVAFQRVLPLLGGTTVLSGVVALALLLPKTQVVHVIMLHVPPLLMILFFTQSEIPTMEIPPLPRALAQKRWHPPMEGEPEAA